MKIKFITLNTEHGGKLFDNIASFIREENPDIVTFQEIFDSKEQENEKRFRAFEEFGSAFSDLLPFSAFKSSCFFINDDYEKGAEYGNAVFSKFEITKNEKTEINAPYGIVDERGLYDYSEEPGILQCVTLSVAGIELNIFNLHGVWGHDGGDNQRRIAMANTILDKIKGYDHVILAGDTNFTKEAVKTIEIIESSGVKSVFGDSLKSTFNMRHKTDPGYATAAVDMIFTSQDIKVLESKMPQVDVSDHYPLMAILEIDEN
jgi:endonuclease/exonuclease/phosphatase family metal-dependent hydrolase